MNPSYLLKQDIVARLYEGSESDNRSVCNLESIWDTDKITPVAVVHLVCSESTQASGAWSYHWCLFFELKDEDEERNVELD